MILHANDLTPAEKAALETLLGRSVRDGESVSVRAIEPASVSQPRRLEIAEDLKRYFAEVDAASKSKPADGMEDLITEAMRSVRPTYRPRQ